MNVALRRPRMSVEEFLAWENRQEERWEFDGFEPRAMVGASSVHNQIAGALEFALRQRLAGRCLVYRETMRLRLEHTARYPDLMVVCTPVANNAQEITDPVVVIEVLSPTTARTDRIEKNREYRSGAQHSALHPARTGLDRRRGLCPRRSALAPLHRHRRRHPCDAGDRRGTAARRSVCRPGAWPRAALISAPPPR